MKIRLEYRAVSVIFLLVLGAVAQPLAALDVSIRFFNQEVYTTESDIHVRVAIQNTGRSSESFRLADQRLFTLDFDVRTMENTRVPYTESYKAIRTSNQPVFFREVTLDPGEEYAFTEGLSRYVELDTPGMYVVRASLHPDLSRDGESDAISSNRLTLSLRPAESVLDNAIAAAEEEVRDTLLRRDLSPDNTVRETIEARQQQRWEQFFLYLDVENIMLRNPRLQRQYRNSSPGERADMVERYKERMQESETEDEILQIPQDYAILQTEYTSSDGSVVAEQYFEYPTYTEIREYTYYLRREDGYWKIYDYSVRSMGTTE